MAKLNSIALDFFVLVSGQIVVCTHLMPAAQLLAAYVQFCWWLPGRDLAGDIYAPRGFYGIIA